MAVDADFEYEIYQHQQAAPAGSLFETFAAKALRHVDEVLLSIPDRRVMLTHQHRRLLEAIQKHQGRKRALPLSILTLWMSCSPRRVKEVVRDMRLYYGVLVCSSRDGDGYWLAATPGEVKETLQPYFAQAISELRVYHAMNRNAQSIDEMLTQIRLELTVEVPHA